MGDFSAENRVNDKYTEINDQLKGYCKIFGNTLNDEKRDALNQILDDQSDNQTAGKRKSRRNRKSKKGKKSRKARKSRRKSNRRRGRR